MTNNENRVRAVVLDWAGTMIDYGSLAPAKVFQRVFFDAGVEISVADAREPMGMAKREHIQAILYKPSVSERWTSINGQEPTEADVDRLYENFLPLQTEVISQHCDLIPGALDTYNWCKTNHIKVASTTGYTRSIMDVVTGIAKQAGYDPEVVLCADDAEKGRPAPWLIFECAKRLDVYPMNTIVKVDDTIVGVEAGLNAGVWRVGVSKSGNMLGLSQAEVQQLPSDELDARVCKAEEKLRAAGAQYVIQSVAELPDVIQQIDQQLASHRNNASQ